MSAEELAKIFNESSSNSASQATTLYPVGYFPTVLALMIRSYHPEPVDVYPEAGKSQPAFGDFFQNIERAVEKYLASEHGLDSDATVTLELEEVRPADTILDEVDDPEQLDLHERAVLEMAGINIDDANDESQ
jgi:hypothetical protein